MRVGVLALLLSLAGGALAQEIPGVDNDARARVNYMLNCQGCHRADGAGTADGAVPTMKNFLGNFLTVSEGREFLIRVPGSANAALTDAALAEVLNWMLPQISPDQIPEDFNPYTEAEVAKWRKQPLDDVIGEREKLIARMGR